MPQTSIDVLRHAWYKRVKGIRDASILLLVFSGFDGLHVQRSESIQIEPVPDSNVLMRLVTPIDMQIISIPGAVDSVSIPVGYSFDGATIPRSLWFLIGHPFDPRYVLAACVHDFFCEASIEHSDYELRVAGDGKFLMLLKRAGVPKWRRTLMFLGVRLNSWLCYGRKSK